MGANTVKLEGNSRVNNEELKIIEYNVQKSTRNNIQI